MAYCEACGLSSCYERGGYCEKAARRLATIVDQLAYALSVKVKWRSGDWSHTVLGTQYNYPENGEWIEVVW